MRMTLAAGVAVLCWAASTALHAEPTKKDEPKILGKWALVSGEKSGEKVPDEVRRGFRMTFAADGKMNVNVDGKDHDGTYKLNTAKKPKEIDFTIDGSNKAGIYVLDGDSLKICVHNGDDRPKEFATQAGVMTMLLVLKRDKK